MRDGLKQRVVEPEMLDRLPPADRLAVGSRRDLRRLNAWMGHAGFVAGVLKGVLPDGRTSRLADLGGGDGQFLLSVAERVARPRHGISAWLVDQVDLIKSETRVAFTHRGWEVQPTTTDVMAWLKQPSQDRFDLILANLFLHHFLKEDLRRMLSLIAERASVFVALEPRRSRFALISSYLVGLLGCNAVTRHDARVSVRAGFRIHDLTPLWPRDGAWMLKEREAGWFSHMLIAQRQAA